MPQDAYNIWFPHNYTFSTTVCLMQALFQELTMNATILTIVAFTIERYIAICHPFRFVCTRFRFNNSPLWLCSWNIFFVVSAFNMRANFISWRLCSRWVYHRVITGQTVEDKNTFKQPQQPKRNEMKWKIKATTTATTTTNQVFWILVMKRWAN